MLKINEIIAHNVEKILGQKKMKQNELADAMKISRSTMREIMDGGKVITPVLQNKIAEALSVKVEDLLSMDSYNGVSQNVIPVLMGQVYTDNAKNAINIADELSEYILFYRNAVDNGKKMEKVHVIEVIK